jgi:hypothetical protein
MPSLRFTEDGSMSKECYVIGTGKRSRENGKRNKSLEKNACIGL